MGREIKGPITAGGIAENGAHHALDELRVIVQEQRGRGVADVHRSGTTVGKALLGNVEQLAVRADDQLMSGQHLPEGQSQQLGILLPAGLHGLGKEPLMEERRPGFTGSEIPIGFFDGGADALPLPIPIGAQVLVEIGNALHIVIGKSKEGGFFCFQTDCCLHPSHIVFPDRDRPILDSQIKIPPVNAQVVPLAGQDFLFCSAHFGASDTLPQRKALGFHRHLSPGIQAQFL